MAEFRLIYLLLNRNWKVCICHAPITQNRVVNHLIKYIAIGFMSLQLIEKPSPLVRDLILIDYNNFMLL